MSPQATGAYAKLEEIGEDAILARVAAAEPVAHIAKDIGIDRVTLWRWLKKGGDERMKAYRESQIAAADIYAEEAVQILDDAQKCENSAQATIAKARSDVRKWLAERHNRDVYGDKQAGVTLNLSVGDLHLGALQKYGSVTEGPKLVLEGKVEPEPDEAA